MIQSKLFRKHFAIAALTVLGFVLLGALVSVAFIRKIAVRPNPQPPVFFARLVEELGAGDPVLGLRRMDGLGEEGRPPFRFYLMDENRRSLAGGEIPEAARAGILPQRVHEGVVDSSRPGPPGMAVVRLNTKEPRFLVLLLDPHRGSGMPPPPTFAKLFPPAFFTLVFTLMVGIACALYLIFRSLRDHVRVADEVIGELQRGNLKARLPIRSKDEIGGAMERFNRMAEEIEQLVTRLQAAETSRKQLLQELAHDLRTPVAALRSLLDTVFAESRMEPPIKELADLAASEIDYISRLVEDLLLLSLVTEPKYKPPQKPLDLLGLLQEEGEAQRIRRGTVAFSLKAESEELLVVGEEHLLRRLVRNVLENAFSFARGAVAIEVRALGEEVLVSVRDDGPGFDPAGLAQFGERRAQRVIVSQSGGRLSLGLGSVIMKAVVSLHRGRIAAKNHAGGGAEIEIILPLR